MARLKYWLRILPLLLLSPLLLAVAAAALALVDLAALIFRPRRTIHEKPADNSAASVVIPNWNGRDLLEKYLPSVIEALSANPRNEIIVVDNGSTDGSAEFMREHFPEVKVLALPENLGFGGGSNAGFRAAANDIVVLLNSDMRVDRGFLAPLLAGFSDKKVFAVSCQIFFSDPARLREETGLTQGWWEGGALRVRHRLDEQITDLYPCFYGGGGSCAFDRRKFLELGCFDALLAPFYLEDTDVGYLAWKRGWKVLYQPQSKVYHEHRGTIGKKFSHDYIQAVLKKNFVLFCWKNIHEPKRLLQHLAFSQAAVLLSAFFGDSPERANAAGILRAFRQLPTALVSRWRAHSLAVISDTETFRRPLGGYFRDRFAALPAQPSRLNVLFLSPYPIYPPIHGGAVFMYQTLQALAKLADVHLIALLDYPHERAAHEIFRPMCASAEFIVRVEGKPAQFGSIAPHAIREFQNADLEWLIHRQIYQKQIDVLQLEYLPMGQYAEPYKRLSCILFEHDIYFQSIARQLPTMSGAQKPMAFFEYLRALRYELRLLPKLDRIQVCSRENKAVVVSYLPRLGPRIDDDLRAGIDVSRYAFKPDGREPNTMLFMGNFRHVPNTEALGWFARQVLPLVLEQRPEAKLVVVGSDPPPRHFFTRENSAIEMRGFVEDIREPLSRYALFVCPILGGSGMRVKLLEAFAAGIPCVSTRLGAEGLAGEDGDVCALADDPTAFANHIVELLDHPEKAADMARRALQAVMHRDMATMTARLAQTYRASLAAKRG